MIPTWPTVFAALIAGLLAGALGAIEFAQPMQAASTSAAATKTASAPTEKSGAEKPAADAVAAGNSTCEQQQWPYVKLNCFDRAARAQSDFEELAVKRADPAVALARLRDDEPNTAGTDKAAKPQVAEQKPATPAAKTEEEPRAEAALSTKPEADKAKPEVEKAKPAPVPARAEKPAPQRRIVRQAPRDRRFREAQLPYPRNMPPGGRIYERRDGTLVYVEPRGPVGYERMPPYGAYPRW